MEKTPGKVYIASMNLRGEWAKAPPHTVKLNVTSAQSKQSKNRRDFSPMTETGYRGFYNFEAFWQSGKKYEKEEWNKKASEYWRTIQKPSRRYPGAKGLCVCYAQWEETGPMNYIESRKNIYVPYYYEMMKQTEMAQKWRNRVLQGENVVIYDFDGPRGENGEVMVEEFSSELFEQKMLDPRHPFGHGYIVGKYISSA
jgi:hypothetical protein